jgi:hypothetical protein
MKVVVNDANPPPGKYVTAAFIAKYFHISVSIVYKWAKADKIPSIRFEDTVRFDFAKVRAIIEGEDRKNPPNS